jgi:predicted kinase
MGTSRDDFTKYPRTPHLFGSRGSDDNKHLGEPESLEFIADPSLIVEEKLDTWLARNRPDLAVVSLDDVRAELEIDATENQGAVVQIAREICREHLRSRRDFAVNATNIVRHTRKRWIDLFIDYGARVEIMYLESALPLILLQNAGRSKPVPEQVIHKLVQKLEPPTWSEAHSINLVGPNQS